MQNKLEVIIKQTENSPRIKRSESSFSTRFFDIKYYSPEKLKKTTQILETEPKFISTDEFFNKRIRTELENQQQYKDIREILGNSKNNQTEKYFLSQIRHKKHQKSLKIDQKSSIFSQETSAFSNFYPQRIKSSFKSANIKKLLQIFSHPQLKSVIPPQSNLQKGLFFKPPIKRLSNFEREQKRKKSNWVTDRSISQKQKELARVEIETIMFKLKDSELQKSQQTKPLKNKSIESALAKSAQKGLKTKTDMLKASITSALINKRKSVLFHPILVKHKNEKS